MRLDAFDREVLEKKGFAQDLMHELYGARLAPGTAKTQLAGIRRHVRFKQKLEAPETQVKDLDERIYHEDGTWTTKRLLMLSEEESQDPQAVLAKMGLDALKWEVFSFKIKRNCSTARKYVRYGVNLIGFSHGKEGKRIFQLMQQEQPQDWGETIFREWHLGDLHHEAAKEEGGVKVRRISSITAAD